MDIKLLAEEIARAVRTRVDKDAPEVELQRVIAQELTARQTTSAHPAAPAAAAATSVLPTHPVGSGPTERIVISANGRNRSGIVAKLTAVIGDSAGDIRDISQTIVADYFTMVIVVDIAGATHQGKNFAEFKQRLEQVGRDIGVHVVALHDDLLSAMHSV